MLRLLIGSSMVVAALVGLFAPFPSAATGAPRSESVQKRTPETAPSAAASSSAGATRDDNAASDAASLTLMTLLLLSGGDAGEVVFSEPAP